MTRVIADLSAREFENLTFDLLQLIGLTNLVWRTPGADGGRDIEGTYYYRDISGYLDPQHWYIECKRYSATIDWPTVWEKIAYAENQGADFLLLVTNSNPSPNCESQISLWNSQRRDLLVRVWRGYELSRILGQYPAISVKYGLTGVEVAQADFIGLASELMKAVQVSHAASALGMDARPSLESAAAISELLSLRMSDLKQYGRIVVSKSSEDGRTYEWLDQSPAGAGFEDASIRALASVLRFVSASKGVKLVRDGMSVELESTSPRLALTAAAENSLKKIALWTPYEMSILNDTQPRLRVSTRSE